MSRETERDLAAMVKVERRAKETARRERDDLRRQLAEARETIMALRLRLSLDNPAYRIAQPEPELSAATGEGEGE